MQRYGYKDKTLVSVSDTTETTIVAAGGAKTRRCPFSIRITNPSATDVIVTIRDTTGGSAKDYIAVKAGTTAGYVLNSDDAIEPDSENTNWTAQASASAANLRIVTQWLQRERS
jgi:hypothetical protein